MINNIFSSTMDAKLLAVELPQILPSINTIELSLPDNNKTNYLEVREFCSRSHQDICKMLQKFDVSAHIHSAIYGNTVDFGSDDATFRKFSEDSIAEDLKFAGAINARDVVIHSKWKPESIDRNCARVSRYLASLERLLKIAQMTNTRILVENVSDPDASWLMFLMDKFPCDNLGICIDIGHVNHFGKKNITAMICEAADKIYSYHVHDNDGSDDSHQHPTSGSINWPEFMKSVSTHTPSARLNLELFDDYGVADKLNWVAKLREWLKCQ